MGTTPSRKAPPATKESALEQAGKTGRLVLAGLKIVRVPAEVWLLGPRLRSLDLSKNGLVELTSQIGSLAKLQALKLSYNALKELPDELRHLDELRVLEADHNQLHSVAAVLPRAKLRSVDLSFNSFSGQVGHPWLAVPPSVVTCNLSHNSISGFSPSFGFEALLNMEELDLDNCEIKELPAAMACMERLTCLKARNNRLGTVPGELLARTKLNRLHLEGNPISLAHLRTLPGFEAFLERRKERISKGLSQGLAQDRTVCGLTE